MKSYFLLMVQSLPRLKIGRVAFVLVSFTSVWGDQT